jgi:hypothetical protein
MTKKTTKCIILKNTTKNLHDEEAHEAQSTIFWQE